MARKSPKVNASNWDKFSNIESKHSIANRDVHEDQQLDRSDIQKAQSKTSRMILLGIVGVFVAAISWGILSFAGWFIAWVGSFRENGLVYDDHPTFWQQLPQISVLKLILTFFIVFGVCSILYKILMKNLAAQNLMSDTSDINQHRNDQHIALPEEVQRKYDWFPDIGAHSSVQVSSMISHMMLSNKGLKKISMAERAKKDVYDGDDLVIHEGEILYDDNGEVITHELPMIDVDFGKKLYEASGIPDKKELRVWYDPNKIPYNPGNENREKLSGFDTLADLINGDWELPLYETQRPTGAYVTDSAPVNTMVLAITRAGKGQTYIEPVIDMWLREKNPNNMLINDPKGELLVKNYVRATVRGYQIIQFNLINAMKTDIYNPLGLAAESAREGDSTKCAIYVENIADVFFPNDAKGSQDPVWNNAANNAFKRAAYGLIDYYLEEEREMRALAVKNHTNIKVLENKLDIMWGRVTLYNCYQFFVRLSSLDMKNPLNVLKNRQESGEFDNPVKQAEFDALWEEADMQAFLWEGKPDMKMLDLFFNATEALPQNTMRRMVSDANNSLKSMAGAEKMLASVYGIAITAMNFFVDPTIATLTSGTPSQNVDLGGFSFPRRIGVRFDADFIKRDHLVGAQVKWEAFHDSMFTKNMGKDFVHEDIISREGWSRYFFKGIFPENSAYLRMKIMNAETGMLIRTFYFRFKKDYQTSLNGRYFITDPILGEKIVKNGILEELRPVKVDGKVTAYKPGSLMYPRVSLQVDDNGQLEPYKHKAPTIMSTMVRYSEKPKAAFLVTPPHLMKYAKLPLILVKQLVDLNFDQSYMTKANQKPLYKTRYMLDELGNLQSDGAGISGFETMLSIGLGQEQQFTIILQTLQQLRDVYGDSVDQIIRGNAQPLTSLIATPNGWIEMGSTKPGTEVLIPAGGTAFVDGIYPQGTRPVYKITRADGSSAEACDEHLWDVIIED